MVDSPTEMQRRKATTKRDFILKLETGDLNSSALFCNDKA